MTLTYACCLLGVLCFSVRLVLTFVRKETIYYGSMCCLIAVTSGYSIGIGVGMIPYTYLIEHWGGAKEFYEGWPGNSLYLIVASCTHILLGLTALIATFSNMQFIRRFLLKLIERQPYY